MNEVATVEHGRKSVLVDMANRERNLRVACDWCHGEKTKADVAEKSTIHRKRAKHIGAKMKKPWSKWRRRMDGTVELRDET